MGHVHTMPHRYVAAWVLESTESNARESWSKISARWKAKYASKAKTSKVANTKRRLTQLLPLNSALESATISEAPLEKNLEAPANVSDMVQLRSPSPSLALPSVDPPMSTCSPSASEGLVQCATPSQRAGTPSLVLLSTRDAAPALGLEGLTTQPVLRRQHIPEETGAGVVNGSVNRSEIMIAMV